MPPKKMVIRVEMNGDKSRSKAMQIVVGFRGVTSAALGEKDKSRLEVIGEEGVDPVKITHSLRKKLGKWPGLACLPNKAYVELISVAEVKDEKKDEPKIVAMPPVCYPEIIRHYDPYPYDSYACTVL